jgi:hypothetical protein
MRRDESVIQPEPPAPTTPFRRGDRVVLVPYYESPTLLFRHGTVKRRHAVPAGQFLDIDLGRGATVTVQECCVVAAGDE